jgi:hypothetical protein
MGPILLAANVCLVLPLALFAGVRPVFAAEPRAVPELGLATDYATQPVVAEVRRAQLWDDATLRLVQHPAMPLDRVLAVADALEPSAVRRHHLASVVTAQLASYHAVGASGALKARDIRVADLAAGEALALGWLRLLALDNGQLGPQAGNRGGSGVRLTNASPLDLLDHAAASAPNDQTPHVALALALWLTRTRQTPPAKATAAGRTAADPQRCVLAASLARVATEPRSISLPKSVAYRVAELARSGAAGCSGVDAWPFPTQWPAPAPEPADVVATGRPPPVSAGPSGQPHRFGEAFVLTAPFFRGWLQDPAVQAVATRKRLLQSELLAVLAADPTGDRTVVVLNAALHLAAISGWDLDSQMWAAITARHPQPAGNPPLTTSQLTSAEALALGYARGLAAAWQHPPQPGGGARTALPQELLDAARSGASMDALLAPLLWQLLAIDRERSSDPCRAADRAEALSVALLRGQRLPPAAQTVVQQALTTVQQACIRPVAKPAKP